MTAPRPVLGLPGPVVRKQQETRTPVLLCAPGQDTPWQAHCPEQPAHVRLVHGDHGCVADTFSGQRRDDGHQSDSTRSLPAAAPLTAIVIGLVKREQYLAYILRDMSRNYLHWTLYLW